MGVRQSPVGCFTFHLSYLYQIICELPETTFVLADWCETEPGGLLHLLARAALRFVSYQYQIICELPESHIHSCRWA
jgi:hypothetical protein